MALQYFPDRLQAEETEPPAQDATSQQPEVMPHTPAQPQKKEIRPHIVVKKQKGGGLFGRISLTERAVFSQNLFVMIKGGIPLAQSLETLSAQTPNKRFRQVLAHIRSEVEQGRTFAKSLSLYPRYFSEVYVNMIAAGEASGKLENVLHELTDQLKKQRALVGKIKNALMYPIIVVIAMVGIGIGMFVYIIPKITSIYKEAGAKLPLPTRMLMDTSDFVVAHGYFVALGAVALVVAFDRIRRTTSGKKIWHTIILRTPVVGTIVKKINLARFARTLHSLLQTDIPIVQSFQIIEHTLGNIHYRMAIADAGQYLKKGTSVVETLKKRPDLFPPMVTQMISVGEQSGTLDDLANEIALFYEEDVDETMANFATIIEPILMLVLGVAVGGIALAVLLPMYSLTEQI